jgi:hypothetical protein
MKIQNNKGVVMLVVSYSIVAVLLILGVAFFFRSFNELNIAERQKNSAKALAIAEAGIEKAFYDLKQDFMGDISDPSWSDGQINTINCGPDYNNFYVLYDWANLGAGQFKVELKNVTGKFDEIWAKSTGTVGGISKIVQTYVKVRNFNIWNNAIFAGSGSSGATINGNVDVRGSVHILGNGLGPADYAFDMSGSAKVGNNYDGISSELLSRIPSCPTVEFNGETVESLDAMVRIKHGLAGLSGTATIGAFNQSGNSYKETAEAVYVTDGYGGSQGADNVYSDNGTEHRYDLGEAVQFPRLSDPHQSYPTYLAYLRDNALVVSDPAQLNQLANIRPDSNFSYSDPDGKGSISMDGSGNLTIDGIVYVDNGGDLGMRYIGPDSTINYTGRGSIVVTGDVLFKVNLYTSGNDSFPDNIIGIMTPNTITFDSSNKDVMGAFYAEDRIIAAKQTNVAGAFVSDYFDMGQQVPSIYQVPDLKDSLPPGMIGDYPVWIILTVAWQEL